MIHAAIWPQQIWAENWGLCPFGDWELGPHLTQCGHGPSPTCMPSFILIRPTVWPECTNVTDRTGQTGQTDQSDSIGRTVLQTVAQKCTSVCAQNSSRPNIVQSSCSHSHINKLTFNDARLFSDFAIWLRLPTVSIPLTGKIIFPQIPAI